MTPAFGKAEVELDRHDRRQFDIIASIAHREAGLVIPPEKAPMVFARLAKRLRSLGLEHASAYCDLVTGPGGDEERRNLVSALTTNVTSFFRETHHFDYLRRHIVPDISDRSGRGDRIRIWSAGCSNGSEPYSIAMVLAQSIPQLERRDVRILATDIDGQVLDTARTGQYETDRLAPVPPELRTKYFRKPKNDAAGGDRWEIVPDLKRIVSFRQLNLLGDWPMQAAFDLIFCRNVVIYFDQATQAQLWDRFKACCKPGGHLFLGHSERLPQSHHAAFRPVATTTYCRHAEPSSGRRDQKD